MQVSPPPRPYNRIVPIIIAVALFMENMDSTVIATSLPAIAQALGTNPLALKLAVTSYLLALAICIPASGWVADRYGARKIFRIAIGVFVLGSIGCALSGSLEQFVLARIVQGMGGAMMTPVGRLILLRSIDKRVLVNAMSLVTITALVGPISGPPLGGFITTYASWHWIFIINVPIGLGRHRSRDTLHSGCSRRAAGALRLCRFRPVRARRRRARFRAVGHGAGVFAGGRSCRPDRRRRHFVGGLCRPRQTHGSADPRSDAVQIADLPRQRFRRVHVQARHWRIAVLVAAIAAARIRPDAVSVGAHHLYRRPRRDLHESGRRERAPALRLPPGVALQQPDQQRVSRRLRLFRAGHAICSDGCHPAQRRLFSFAAIHQHQHHRLCRSSSRGS